MPNNPWHDGRMTVYYEVTKPDFTVGTCICTTEKAFFDRNGFVDDGASGAAYEAISLAMEACGAPELCESVFETALPVQTVIDAMRARGFDLVKDPAFSAFIASTN